MHRATIVHARTSEQVKDAGSLFREYAGSLGIDLSFQDFERELLELPGDYSEPDGCILLAFWNADLAGCVGLRPITSRICEMKRMYVRSTFRGKGIGRDLTQAVIREAKKRGYAKMRLDTLPTMKEAQMLYRSLGFRQIPPYRLNPIHGAIFMELDI